MLKCLLILTIFATLVAGCLPSSNNQLDANKKLVQQFTTLLNNANWDAVSELLTEDFHRHCQATPGIEINSREEFIQLQKSFLVSMPDQHVVLDMLIAEGNMVTVYATITGTQTGPMGNFPITGKSVNSKFLGIFRISNNRIAELWVEWDNLAMLTQLGVFPPPGVDTNE